MVWLRLGPLDVVCQLWSEVHFCFVSLQVTLSMWRQYKVAKSVGLTQHRSNRIEHLKDIRLLKMLSSSPHIVQLIGYCGTSSLVTEYHRIGNLDDIHVTLRAKVPRLDAFHTRVKIAESFLRCLKFLHEFKPRPLIVCDSCSLDGYLKQFLVTNTLEVVLTDLDSVELASRSRTTCRCHYGRFRPPEEIHPNGTIVSEKRDIWRAARVIWFILGCGFNQSSSVDLQNIYRMCTQTEAVDRPDAATVLTLFQKFAHALGYY